MSYDRLRPFEEAPYCPICAMEMNFISTERKRDGSYHSLKYECPTCHLRQTTTTRNNVRMAWSFIAIFYGSIIGFAVGVIFSRIMLYLTALKH
jgi:hypothetical protein